MIGLKRLLGSLRVIVRRMFSIHSKKDQCMWENSNSQFVQRAKSEKVSDRFYVVTWKGGEYEVIKKKSENRWLIYRSHDSLEPIHVVEEQFGLGKEEAIAWIEGNV